MLLCVVQEEARPVHFNSESLPASERTAGYVAAVRRYFSEFASTVSVEVAEERPTRLVASVEPVTIGGLRGGIHRCNYPHRLSGVSPSRGERGLALFVICDGQLQVADSDGDLPQASSMNPVSTVGPGRG
jgi:hypothetical protein